MELTGYKGKGGVISEMKMLDEGGIFLSYDCTFKNTMQEKMLLKYLNLSFKNELIMLVIFIMQIELSKISILQICYFVVGIF